jgi:hypothetical protein
VKKLTILIFLCFCWVILPALYADNHARYFDKLTKDKYILVVLYENGKAEYLQRGIKPNGGILLLHDAVATWSYFPNQPKNTRPNIWVQTKRFRFDYFLEGSCLTEYDKTGIQEVLTERKTDSK